MFYLFRLNISLAKLARFGHATATQIAQLAPPISRGFVLALASIIFDPGHNWGAHHGSRRSRAEPLVAI